MYKNGMLDIREDVMDMLLEESPLKYIQLLPLEEKTVEPPPHEMWLEERAYPQSY